MYSAGYGFGNNAPSFNNPAPQQPGAQPAAQQMMYNQQQQFAGMTPQGAFGPGANPQMMPGGPAGMMPNAGMQHMAANGQMAGYQQQFPGAPYGQVVPSSVAPQSFAPNYMMGGGMQGFPMNQAGMPQQPQMIQRMQQQQQQQSQQQQQQQQQPPNPAMGQVSTPQRPMSAVQGTPNNALPSQQGQFQTPQPPSQSHTPTNQQAQAQQPPQQNQQQQQPQQPQTQPQQQQQTPASVQTPQTPTFSTNQGAAVNGGSTVATPLSPGTESRDKERFALLLDINHELLYESIQLQTTQQELKKEHAADGNAGDKKPTEEETLMQQDYLQCMRRLQANLSYMAALADRKPEVKVPPCPAYLSAPPLNLSLKLRAPAVGPDGSENKIDPVSDREERDKSIKDLYSRLQAAFPGFDPKKEPAFRMNTQAGGQKAGNPAANQGSPTAQKTPQMTNMPAPPMPQPGMPS
ncbi:CYC8-general repressor of transcription [Fusarium albosuccineum]|uniref:CYC8-general repressor of transcription n=1 Tax=Fusarium albosuccineum TaxID=1237068 RepID=A0A8H4LGE6_9HYPO|nr:CYC8-general repressor of transcription [Fusarium albosuccineum]